MSQLAGGDAASQMLGTPCVCPQLHCACGGGSTLGRDATIGVVCFVLGSAVMLLVAYIHKLRRRAAAATNAAPSPSQAYGAPQLPPPPPPPFPYYQP